MKVNVCNIIMIHLLPDYFRAIFLFASCYYMTTDYIRASLFYMLSGFLDALDGYFARILNQGTKSYY